jgi:hypothetical protein
MERSPSISILFHVRVVTLACLLVSALQRGVFTYAARSLVGLTELGGTFISAQTFLEAPKNSLKTLLWVPRL